MNKIKDIVKRMLDVTPCLHGAKIIWIAMWIAM